jgi:hypothetical protein
MAGSPATTATAEIVLQKFRGELQMLDARGQGGDAQISASAARSGLRPSIGALATTRIGGRSGGARSGGGVAGSRATSTTRSRSEAQHGQRRDFGSRGHVVSRRSLCCLQRPLVDRQALCKPSMARGQFGAISIFPLSLSPSGNFRPT